MKINKWTIGLAAAGLVTLPAGLRAEEKVNYLATALSSTTISGYVNTSAHWDLGSGNANNPAYAFGGADKSAPKADGFNMNVVKLAIEKPLSEEQWAAGYKAELLFGPDARTFSTLLDSGGNRESLGIKQAYVQVRAPVGNGLDFKLGVYDTIIGYEVFDAGGNPNYTRSYGYTIEPTTHTGVLMSYQFCEAFSASVGVANTVGPVIGQRAFGNTGTANNKSESFKTYMASFTLTAPKDWGFLAGSAFYAGVISGFNNSAPTGGPGAGDGAVTTSWYGGATVNTPLTALKLGLSYDYLEVNNQPLTTGVSSGHAWALGGYASYQATEKLSFHGRTEFVAQSADWAIAGLPGKIYEFTATAQYDLWKNVLSRLEFRWDHSAAGGTTFGKAYGDDGTGAPSKKNAFLLAANLIYKF